MTTPILQGMHAVVARYDGFVLDLWGVVHDGVTVFPGVIDALERLRDASKKLVFLSNAPRRAESVAAQLDGVGITAALHHGGEQLARAQRAYEPCSLGAAGAPLMAARSGVCRL